MDDVDIVGIDDTVAECEVLRNEALADCRGVVEVVDAHDETSLFGLFCRLCGLK